jgi:enoyl-CoA hydratase/carnithine racemase
VSARSLFALIEPGSCFAGSCWSWPWPATAATCWRCPTTPQGAAITVGDANFGLYPMATGQSRLGRRFYDEQPALEAVRAKAGQALDADAAFALGLVTSNPDDIDWADECASPSRSAWRCPRRADRHGSQPALQRPREHVHAHLRPPDRLAELDLPAPNAVGERAR